VKGARKIINMKEHKAKEFKSLPEMMKITSLFFRFVLNFDLREDRASLSIVKIHNVKYKKC